MSSGGGVRDAYGINVRGELKPMQWKLVFSSTMPMVHQQVEITLDTIALVEYRQYTGWIPFPIEEGTLDQSSNYPTLQELNGVYLYMRSDKALAYTITGFDAAKFGVRIPALGLKQY